MEPIINHQTPARSKTN